MLCKLSSYRRAFGEALVEAGARSKDVIVLDADTARSTGTIEFARRFPDRFINVGISEQDLVATAAGLAIAGKTPVATAFSMFMLRAWEQIRNTIARDRLNVKLVGTHSGLSDYMDGASHQCFEDIALMRVLPGFTVLVPSDPNSTRQLLLEATLNHVGPAYIRLGRDNAPVIYSRQEEFVIGGSKVIEDGGEVVIFSCGAMVGVALEALRILREQGIRAGLVDVYSIKPVDRDTIIRQSRRANLVVTLEDHSIHGGLGSLVTEVLSSSAPRRVLMIGIPDSFGTSARSYQQLLEYMKLTPKHVARLIAGELG